MNTESEFVAHEPCNNCGSSDANSRYSDGHAYCFACQTYTPAEGDNYTPRMNTNERVQFLGSAEQLQKRRISEKTNEFYRIYRHGNTLRFPYYDESGRVVGFKIKTSPKTSTTKELLLKSLLRTNTYFQQVANELSSQKEN